MQAVSVGDSSYSLGRRSRSSRSRAFHLLCRATLGLSLFGSPVSAQQQHQFQQPAAQHSQQHIQSQHRAEFAPTNVNVQSGMPPVRTVQYSLEQQDVSGQVDAVHSPNVDRFLKPQYKLELERRHSQLVITNRNIRRIAVTDPTIVNYVPYTPKELSVVGLELGKTDLTLWFEDDPNPAIYEVTVVRDSSLEEQRTIDFGRLERRLTELFPNSRVHLIPIGAQVIVQGQAYDSEEAQHILQIVRTEVFRSAGQFGDDDDNNLSLVNGGAGLNNGNLGQNGNQGFRDIIVNRMTVPGEFNVKMRVTVAELNRSALRDAGLSWNVLFNDARHSVGGSLGGAPGTTLSGIFENGEIAVFLKWLQSNGTVTLLAEPTLVTLSGTTASILGGGEFAVPTVIGLGGGQTTTFRGFGTSLLVTPTVMDRDNIRLQVVPEFSELNADNSVNGIPGTNVKRVMTQVELREGQTFAIGGLISRQTLTEVSRIPLLGDIPYIGPALFHSKTASEVETELLVLVQPEIVRPMEPDEVPPLPNYYVTHPNDYDLWKYARTEGNPDTQVYQVPPYGTGATYGVPQGYSLFNPPVNHGGFVPGQNSQPMMGGPQPSGQNWQQPPMPQPDYQIPQGGGIPQGHSYPVNPAPPVQHYQAPAAAVPATPLPPVPQPYPAQSQNGQQAPKSTMRTRMASVFKRDADPAKQPVRTTGWTRGK
ncbi:MAG: pilus assembly protein N-terminal domain-containing protein [Planctomyces sp.]|nr:pilus assembly protein N-terminal domain-containing protein [Planctomyces sp.]